MGYDVAEAAYFHRELPYDAARVEAMNPRLANARALVAAGAVRLEGELATVAVGDHGHRVRFDDGRWGGLHLLVVGPLPGRPRQVQARAGGRAGPRRPADRPGRSGGGHPGGRAVSTPIGRRCAR